MTHKRDMGPLLGTTKGRKRWDYSVTCPRPPTTKEPIPALIRATRKRERAKTRTSDAEGTQRRHEGHEVGEWGTRAAAGFMKSVPTRPSGLRVLRVLCGFVRTSRFRSLRVFG